MLHTVAKLHYEADLPQVEIAQRLKLSTAMVSRLLRRARTEGIVRIEVRDLETAENVNADLAERLGLRRAIVVDTGEAGGTAALAAPAGALLKEAGLASGSVMAIGWGRAVREVITAGLPRMPGVLTVPATGGMQQPGPHFQIGEFVRLAADQMGGTPHFIHVPYLPSRDAREALLRDVATSENLALWDRIDAALVGIGVPHHGVVDHGRLQVTRDEQELVQAAGDVIRHYFDDAGTLIPWEGAKRLVAVSPGQLRRIPLVVGVAASPHKAKAIRGAARAGMINALVTDLVTARTILDLPE
ncbi:sugar-binding domain-containing protein [Lichenihabitans sp. Uapishka_5]|uniref:sugar-binding transcriptional regulator n=1 Tax=Lichenihabitans sp. Uapishka_5 TaxID=3037302 RepID=UPI0029E7CBD6|nr:sugar-binding domain-containing protein [Lichenihabitans sp. Uapishka_5]MDX7950560.1 sugar-binding domain-containing protein [Lichenihabitans sp. Uapishka_5]